MKYAFMSYSCPKLTIGEMVEAAIKYGYDGIEPRISGGHLHGIEAETPNETLRQIGRLVREKGLEICCIATPCLFADPEKVEKNLDLAKRCIELSAETGSPCIRVFGGRIPEGIERKASQGYIIDSLTKLSDFAAQSGVTICMETHDHWCDPKDITDIMTAVNHPSVAVNWDIMHPVLTAGWTVEQAFNELKPWIRHAHMHDGVRVDGKVVFSPIGTGPIDHRSAVKLLKDMKYEGFISGEWINWEPHEIHLHREIASIKSYE